MQPEDKRPIDQGLGIPSVPTEKRRTEGAEPAKNNSGRDGGGNLLVSRWLAAFSILFCAIVLGVSAFIWGRAGGSPIGLVGAFLGILLLAAVRSSLRGENRQGTSLHSQLHPGRDLRAAVILALLVLVGLELDLLKGTLDSEGLAGRLLPALLPSPRVEDGRQIAETIVTIVHPAGNSPSADVSWSSAFVIVVLIVAMAAIMLVTLSVIGRIARED